MTSKERVRIAMNLGVPDRVPVFAQLSIGHYFLHAGVDPMDVWFTTEGLANAMVKLQKEYQFDGILVNHHGTADNWRSRVARIEDMPSEKWIHWKNGCITKFPPNDNPHYYQSDGVTRYFPTFQEIDPDFLHYVEPWDDTDITYPYTWGFEEESRPKDDFFPPFINDRLKNIIAQVGDTVSVHGEIFSPFSQFLELLNYEHALIGLLDDPEKCHACLDALTHGAIELGRLEAETGTDAILMSSAFAGGGFISCDTYEEFVLPYEKRVVAGIKEKNPELPIYTHTCGAIGDRLDLMMETGINGIDTLDPPPLGTVDLEKAAEQTKGKVFIRGNIDPVNTLLLGNKEKITEVVERCLEVAAPGGGYIVSTACAVAPPTDPEMLKHMSSEVIKKGVY